MKKNTTFTDTGEEGARSWEGTEEGDRKEPLRFETLEVTSFEQLVPDRMVKTYDEVMWRKIVITPSIEVG